MKPLYLSFTWAKITSVKTPRSQLLFCIQCSFYWVTLHSTTSEWRITWDKEMRKTMTVTHWSKLCRLRYLPDPLLDFSFCIFMNCCKKLPSFANLFEEAPWGLGELLGLEQTQCLLKFYIKVGVRENNAFKIEMTAPGIILCKKVKFLLCWVVLSD